MQVQMKYLCYGYLYFGMVNMFVTDLKEVKNLQEDHLAIFLWVVIFPIVFHIDV